MHTHKFHREIHSDRETESERERKNKKYKDSQLIERKKDMVLE